MQQQAETTLATQTSAGCCLPQLLKLVAGNDCLPLAVATCYTAPRERVAPQGGGTAQGVQIQSLQPMIKDNAEGLYVSFTIVGVLLGLNLQPAALEVTVGDIPPGGTAEVRFLLTSTLAVR